MAGKNIVTINGRHYDALTGKAIVAGPQQDVPRPQHQPGAPQAQHKPYRVMSDIAGPSQHHVAATKPSKPQTPRQAGQEVRASHKQLQKSQTLRRAGLQKPTPTKQLAPVQVEVDSKTTEAPKTPTDYNRSPSISKFGPSHAAHFSGMAAKSEHKMIAVPASTETPVRQHPVVAKALAERPAATQPVERSPRELKEALIRERLAEARPAEHGDHSRHRARRNSQPRLATILTSSLALLLLAGYLTYINLPNISMRVAAVRAGIAANYPNYSPDGYHFNGPISYKPGEVNITFKSNTNQKGFTIKQQASSWDSKAVLDNYVVKKTGTYLTYQERGLTIYSFGDQAAWVNGGLLYTINGDAPLSSEQLLNIATSM